MRFFLTITLILSLFTQTVFAIAPLDGKYAQAPRDSATQEEKARASAEARIKVIEASKKYLGTPYVYGGMSSSGVDCSAFICLSFKDALNVALPRSAAGQYNWTEKISFDKAQPGDLLFFRTANNQDITHVGLYLGNNLFINSASAGEKTGVVYASLNERYWANTFAGAGRALPEATQGFNADTWEKSEGSLPKQDGSSRQDNSSSIIAGGNTQRQNMSSYFFTGAGISPIFDLFNPKGNLVRGVTSQIFVGAEFSEWLTFGIELRPEFDVLLNNLRLPLTLSWGRRDIFKIFAGPVLSINFSDNSADAVNLFGTAGVTIFPINYKNNTVSQKRNYQFDPYLEFSWLASFSDIQDSIFFDDFFETFRFTVGLRWKMRL
ncbi:MAG: C40 family peptidase [Treponema sp.]|nr:C40 family peptidase [Treponema sp.]MCL2252144.1 C40 family peptidase [Treponema sp.]